MNRFTNSDILRARLESDNPKEVKAEKARQRKQKQRALESKETLEQTHRRRRDTLLKQHKENDKKTRNTHTKALENIRKKHTKQRADVDKTHRRGTITTEQVSDQLKTIVDNERTNLQTETRKMNKSLGALNERHTKQNKKQREVQQKQRKQRIQKYLKRNRKSGQPGEPFVLFRVNVYQVAKNKFETYVDDYVVRVNIPELVDVVDVFLKTLKETISLRNLKVGDRISLGISHDTLTKHPYTGKLTEIPNGNLDEFLMSVIKKILEFKEYNNIPLDELTFHVRSVKIPSGSGYLKPTRENTSQKRSIIVIKNKDTMCMARAIVTAVANKQPEKWTKSQLQDGFNRSRGLQRCEAEKIHENSGVRVNDWGNNLDDALTFAEHLGVQINIFDSDNFNSLIFTGGPKGGDNIYLQKMGNHFNVIKSMPGFLAKKYYCHTCKVGYKKRDCHKCPDKCLACFKSDSGCKANAERIVCVDCNRTFFGQKCFEEHKRNRASKPELVDVVCTTVQKCLVCFRTVKNLGQHVCGFVECGNCGDYSLRGTRKCYMLGKECKGGECTRKTKIDGCDETTRCVDVEGFEEKMWCYSCKTRSTEYKFYDFETAQNTGVHKVNFAYCEDFKGLGYEFANIDEFCEFALNKKGCTFIAHNGKSFDMQFVLKYCIEHDVKPFCIYSGSKIMYMSVGTRKNSIKFIDSINFIQSRLADFPKTFGLTEIKKGFFPHYFNKPCNQNYVGPMPSRKHYGPDQMRGKDRENFLKWYQERIDEDYVFNFQDELRSYCKSDVNIMRRSMLQFRQNYIDNSNIDPLQYVTIASVSMSVYRGNFMPANKIAVVKDKVCLENFSKTSINWLNHLSKKHDIHIKHATNGGEHKITGVGKVDGFCEATNTVYEFQGCFWHGCTKCFSPDTINTRNQIDMGELQTRTVVKSNKIRSLGYKLVEMYECELKKDHKFKRWCKENDTDIITPLNPRDAFFGGRTNVTKLRYTFKRGEKGRYADFVSLYPTVQFSMRYPVGHPDTILNPETYDTEWFGFVKCKVLPPRKLYHPVLPVKIDCVKRQTVTNIDTGKTEERSVGTDTKLVFALCRSCAETQSQDLCTHTNDERAFVGTWCTPELEKALEKGYKITKIYEVQHFKETTTGLFKDYIRSFLKLKIESSHPPKTGPGMKYESLEHFKKYNKEKFGIELGEIKYNPGMRAIAKMALNSLWGKFGQRTNMSQTEYVNDPEKFFAIILNDEYENVEPTLINENMMQIRYNLKDKFEDNRNNTNIYIAAFTTAHARVMLYDVLDKLGDRVLGYDTDSVWYVERPGDIILETGDSLGDMTNELDEGDYIVEWVGTGPKSYANKTKNGVITCKVKGFTLNYENSKHINFDSMVKLINHDIDRVTTVKEAAITRDPKTKNIVNKYQEKDFTVNYNKRVVDENLDTLPYGY